jgi:phage shock protein C
MNKKLYRSRDDRMIAGVCGGLAEYFNIDPVIVRIIAIILLFPGWLPGFVPYIILWIVVPEKPRHKNKKRNAQKRREAAG